MNIFTIFLICVGIGARVNANTNDYWAVGNKGFLPMNKEKSCESSHMKDFCHVLQTNPTTEEIDKAANSIQLADLFFNSDPPYHIHSNSIIEDTFHWFSVGLCRIGYNQNPTGDNNGIPIIIPSSVSYRLLVLANYLQREPTTGYASLVLDNCVYKENEDDEGDHTDHNPNSPDETITYDNWEIQRTVTVPSEEIAHRTEKGFYASHCSVELSFADAITSLKKIEKLLNKGNGEDNGDNGDNEDNQDQFSEQTINKVTRELRGMAYNVRKAIPVLKQMRHYFNSEHFFTYLRPFVKCGNIGENGIVFEGEEEFDIVGMLLPNNTQRVIEFNKVTFGFRGPTGAQTTSLSTIDAGLQIVTSISSDRDLETTMKEFRQYHPKTHYEFNERVSRMMIRDYIMNVSDETAGIVELTDAYNDAVTAVAEWRYAHVDHVMTYIFKSIPYVPKNAVTGTGNTPISSYLCKSALGTLKSRIRTDGIGSKNLPTISIPSVCSEECFANDESACSDYCEYFSKVNK